MELNIKEASNFLKVARSTIYKKISSGELSRLPSGNIDQAELLRVFGEPNKRQKTQKKTRENTQSDTVEKTQEIALLQEKIRLLEQTLHEVRHDRDWLRGKVDTLTDTVKLLQAPQPESKKKEGFFSRFFG
jgi:hypothetical protein